MHSVNSVYSQMKSAQYNHTWFPAPLTMPLEEAESQSSEKAAACPNLILVSKSSRMSPEPEKILQSMLLLLTVS